MARRKARLRYVGGGRFIVGVPARDIEVDPGEARRLVRTGLYELVRSKAGDQTTEGPSTSEAPTAAEPTQAPTGE